MLNTVSKDKWQRIGSNRRAGLLVPLFSVYSKASTGIGDLADLGLLIELAAKSGNSIIQLLPMNEMGSVFCPYDALSSFALEPVYLSLNKIDAAGDRSIRNRIDSLKKTFPTGKGYVDYGIKKAKIDLLWEIYLRDDSLSCLEFKEFSRANTYWLDDFALFKVLKNHYQGKPWYEWDEPYSARHPLALEAFKREHEREIGFELWLQWQLYKQFRELRCCAEKRKILFKGDLPILVSRDSADVWQHPEFFKLEFSSGAPPDVYCAKGQRWGMPTYNWERISQDGYAYLKEKLRYAQNFYDILRVDHVVGLFRIWSIPYNDPRENQGLHGFFDPKDEKKWEAQGREILSTIVNSTDMLICAEDLGVIPPSCPKVMKELGIPGNDVQRWVKDWQGKHDFLSPQDYRLLSVSMLSTHDTTNWPAWWENEAGTVDEGLFIRKCSDHRQISFSRVKDRLFDSGRSLHGRLRWRKDVDSVDKLIAILGKKKEEVGDFIDLYKNSYGEKELLWLKLGLKGPMREKCDADIMQAVLKANLASRAIFCVNLLIDWLYLTGIFKGDPYSCRVNTPGTVNDKNWSLTIPISLDELFTHRIVKKMKEMIVAADRV